MTVLTEAYVLKKKLRGDFDRQYVLLTKELGKVNALAKSASKPTSKLAPHLEFFCLVEVMLAPGVSFYRLAGAKIKCAHRQLNRNLFKSVLANVFFELVDLLLLEKNQEERIFFLVQEFLEKLDSVDNGRGAIIVFNKSLFQLLTISGYEPPLAAKSQTELSLRLVDLVQEVTDKRLGTLPALKKILTSA